MKKLYIQPSMEIEIIETLDMIADSGTVATSDAITNTSLTSEQEVDQNLTGGSGNNFGSAKGNTLWSFDDDEE